jgi:Domain of unknown function (DUF2760)
LSRISAAFKSFFSILFSGQLPADVARNFGYVKAAAAKPAPAAPPAPPKPQAGPHDGAVQILSILQSDARMIDFLMEDISAYSDDQVGAAVRDIQTKAHDTLQRYMKLAPVVDGVEGVYVKTEGLGKGAYKLVGNVPPNGKAPGGLLRHKGWKAEKVDLPNTAPAGGLLVAAEIEVE